MAYTNAIFYMDYNLGSDAARTTFAGVASIVKPADLLLFMEENSFQQTMGIHGRSHDQLGNNRSCWRDRTRVEDDNVFNEQDSELSGYSFAWQGQPFGRNEAKKAAVVPLRTLMGCGL